MQFFKNKKNLVSIIIFVGVFLPFISFAQLNQHSIGYIPSFGLGSDASIEEIFGNIIQLFLGFLGFVALVLIIIAGFKWMTSGGNPEKIASAKKMLVAAIIGLVIILASYVITVFLMRTFIEATNSDNDSGGDVSCGNPGGCVGCLICGYDGNLQNDDGCYTHCTQVTNTNTLHVSWKSPTGSNVDLCSMIQVGFNYDVNENSVNSTTFRVNKCNANICDQPVSGNLTVEGDIIQFKPSNNYDANSTYEVGLPAGGIKSDSDENLISLLFSETWRFSTGATLNTQLPRIISILPLDDATEVCRNSNIKVKFSRDMDALSLKDPSVYFSIFARPNLNEAFSPQNISFNKKIYSGDTLFLKPTSNYIEDFEYAPLLDGSKIKDSCGNSLDGNANNILDVYPADNYPPNNNHDDWNFFTGKTLECKPELISEDLSAYYDDGDLVIEGTYLDGASLMFNNEIAININSNFCMSSSGVAGVACSQASDWQEDKIKVKVPAISGVSNGAKSGDIKVITQYNKTLTSNFTLLSPRIDSLVSPNIGGKGQFITIKGQNFGEIKGASSVYFRKDSQIVQADFPCGSNSWKNNRIIISVPESINDLGPWEIQVQKISNISGSEEGHWSNLAPFTVNSSNAGPGLCEISPENVKFEDEFTLIGKMLGGATGATRKVIVGNQYTSQDAIVSEWLGETSGSQSTGVKAKMPNLQPGEVGVRVVIGEGTNALYSNFLSLNIFSTESQALRISYIEPTSGPAGSYVTIYGNGFGKTKGDSNVEFKFNNNQWVEGDFEFPNVCSTNYWTDNKIIVKVPQDFNNLQTASAIRVLVNGATSTEAVFQVNTNAIPPSICGILPSFGTKEDTVSIFGEYFGNNPVAIFNYINNAGNEVQATVIGGNSIEVVVPQTQTGPVAVRNENGDGNTLNFEYIQDSETSTEEFDFYGWHFRTCETCGIPRVKMQTCSSAGNSSPSPFPGYPNVPLDMNIYVEFEYSDKTSATMDEPTLNTNNIKLYKCIPPNVDEVDEDESEPEPYCPNEHPILIGEITTSSVTLNPSSNLEPKTTYRVVLTSAIKDFEGSSLIPFDWFFTTGVSGHFCQANKLRVYPDYGNVAYSPNKELSYFTQIWDTNGCYLCNNNYSYNWEKNDTENLVSWLDANNSASTTKVKINSDGRFGELDISAKNTTFTNLTDSSHLKIIPDCSSFNKESDLILRQNNCISHECCWDASSHECLNEGNVVCNSPFIHHKKCLTTRGITIMGSPSPKSTNIYSVPVNANILARFNKKGKKGELINMDKDTYSLPGAIKIFKCNVSSQALDLNSCNDVTSDLGPIDSGSSNTFQVEYSTSLSDFDSGYWYKILLTDLIKDSTGQSLQEEYWTFKTGDGLCNPSSISVDSQSDVLTLGKSQEYVANCFDNNCTICDEEYTYLWEISNTDVANFLVNNTTNTTTVFAINIGTTKIHATNLSVGNLTNFANLKVVSNSVDPDDSWCSDLPMNDCNSSGRCCWNANTSQCVGLNNPVCGGLFQIKYYEPTGNDVCPNTVIKITFDTEISYSTLQNRILIKNDKGETVNSVLYSYLDSNNNSVVVLEPISGLSSYQRYQVHILKGIKSEKGGELNCTESSNDTCFFWEFKTAESVCSLNSINIISPVNKFYEFNTQGEDVDFVIEEISSNGSVIHPIQGVYDWNLKWESKDNTLVDIKSGIDSTLNIVPFEAKNKNGKTTVKITASALENPLGYAGPDLYDEAGVEVFLCEDPWTTLIDEEYNFSIKYCKDGNLPNLYIRSNANVSGGQLKEYILTFNPNTVSSVGGLNNSISKIARLSSNSFILNIFSEIFGGITNKLLGKKVFARAQDYEQDVIGLRVYRNSKHYSPSDWYRKSGYITFTGNPKATKVDSYNAIKDGTTVYVNAGNKTTYNLKDNFNTYIYLLSYNSNASSVTQGIVAQLLKNWQFNTNINDIDEKNNLIQDVKRWEDFRVIESMLDDYASRNRYCAYTSNPINGSCSETADLSYVWRDDNANNLVNDGECYSISNDVKCSNDEYCQNHKMKFNKCITKYPELNSGTYKKGVSVSVWPSWKDTLSNQIGSSLPVDPVNEMEDGCYGDPITCWDSVTNTFICPKYSKIYYYQSRLGGGGFQFYALFNNANKSRWGGDNSTINAHNLFYMHNLYVCHGSASGCKTNGDCGDCEFCNLRTHECESKCGGNKPYCIDPINMICGECNSEGLNNNHCVNNPCEICNLETHTCEYACEEGMQCVNNSCAECRNSHDCGDCNICSGGACVNSCTDPDAPYCLNNQCVECVSGEQCDAAACYRCSNAKCSYSCTEGDRKSVV
ncbi:MAG: Ig-like domain-containing protein [Patescibacteria group bacterium]|nr:Ig-like domain-containing protein [Patescibacteria group bacterium]